MPIFVHLLVTSIVFLTAWLFSYWMLFVQIIPDSLRGMDNVLALLTGGTAAWFMWRRLKRSDSGIFSAIVRGAMIVGAIGFVGGFFGPMLFAPDANQGPMLGLFITGPGGFLLGGLGGGIWWRSTHPKRVQK